MTLRYALEESRNVPTVKLLDGIGPAVAIDYAKRFGLTGNFRPFLSLALGATEETLLEATSAFTVFPHQGVRMAPFEVLRVADRQGNLLEENRPEPHDAIRADTAYVMTTLLEGVATRGTAAAAASLDWPVAGKTGTMDDYTDAWFIGFDPDITVGVWVGYDQKKSLGRGETGASAALPIWMDVMKAYIAERGREDPPRSGRPATSSSCRWTRRRASRRRRVAPSWTPSFRARSPKGRSRRSPGPDGRGYLSLEFARLRRPRSRSARGPARSSCQQSARITSERVMMNVLSRLEVADQHGRVLAA